MPRTKLPARPTASFHPASSCASPPEGVRWKICIRKIAAAASRAKPIPIWILRRGASATKPAPSHEPGTPHPVLFLARGACGQKPRAKPRAEDRGPDHQHEGPQIDNDDGDED